MKLKYSIFLIIIFQVSCAQKQLELPVDIAEETQERIDSGYHLGTVIGIIDKNGPCYYSFGQMSLKDSNKPDENSIFEIGYLNKFQKVEK